VNYYDKLGVKKNATQEEIQRAFRRRAAESHPDRGGDPNVMAEINRAYACLKDPVKRLAYDRTGEEPPANSIESLARDLLLQQFMQLLKDDVTHHLVGTAATRLRGAIADLKRQQMVQRQSIDGLQRRSKDVSVKRGVNLWQQLLNDLIRRTESAFAESSRNLEVHELALKILGDYDDRTASNAVVFSVTWGSTTTTGT
jgi:DnaJ-class molecular chaperone